MSIQEALERKPDPKWRTVFWPRYKIDREHYYKEIVLNAGLEIHKEARTPKLLEELEEVIKPNFSDVKISSAELDQDGSVNLRIEWNFRQEMNSWEPSYPERVHNAIGVNAYPLNGNLVIIGYDGMALLTSMEWRSDDHLLEDAIVHAYRNPRTLRDGSRL